MPSAKKDRKEDIFEAALQCFIENGYYRTSLDTIADKARISKGGIYYHFKSKDELFIKLFTYRCEKYFEHIRKEIQEIDDPEKRLEQFVSKASSVVIQNEDFLRFFLEFMAIGARDPEINKVMTEYYRDSVANFKHLIEAGIATGKYKKMNAAQIARGVYFLSMGIFFTYFTVKPDFNMVDEHIFHIDNTLETIKKKG